MALPRIIDNDRKVLLDVLKEISKDHKKLSIATGYWDLKSISFLEEQLENFDEIRLLIGREPLIPRHKLFSPEKDFPEQDFSLDLAQIQQTFRFRSSAEKVTKWIEEGKLNVRIFTENFLHAKAYIFGDFSSEKAVGIIGSSNFTGNGLTQNTELNALESDHRVVTYLPKSELQETGHLYWFEKLWNHESTIDWTGKFTEIVQLSPVGNLTFSPFEMYIKTLHTLYKQEIEDEDFELEVSTKRSLFDFQQKNAQALLRRLRKYNVAMLADSVGLGKTTTAISVIKNYLEDESGRKRIEIICPKSIVQQWEKELTTEGIYGQKPITLQNPREIASKQELDQIASVSLFVIDESHNLRQTSGTRFQQLLDWIRSNPQAHVLLLTATPINNSLSDLTNQILLGSGGNAEIMKVTVTENRKQTAQLTFYQAVENLKKKINQDLKRTGSIDYEAIRMVMAPIIRTFVVRRTRQGIKNEYGSLIIDGKESTFPTVIPDVIEYTFDNKYVTKIKNLESELLDLKKIFRLNPEDLMEKTKSLSHPYRQAKKLENLISEDSDSRNTPMFYIFQLILLLGFLPYRWMIYQTKFHGKTREQIHELRLTGEESKQLLNQLGILGILRTVFLKRMESSVSALRKSLDTYERKLVAFEKGISQGKIFSVSDIAALEGYLGDEDIDVDSTLLEDLIKEEINPKSYQLPEMLEDIKLEKELIKILDKQLEIISEDDSKVKEFAKYLDEIRKDDPQRKVLVFTYFSDTIKFLEKKLFEYSSTATPGQTGFLSSSNRADAENFASRFSPRSKLYSLKPDEPELNLLISTDVLSEGQNLQDAGVLINFDLHWNPVRMIQRNGRVNRLGSVFKEVNVFNMKPESALDSYLRLIQRLQSKIDIIRSTIGTDTPVLDEIENPIEYVDSLNDIYSKDLQTRIKAIDEAELATDFLLSEDEFVLDLKKFKAAKNFTEEYKKKIFDIPEGKWGFLPSGNNDLKVISLCGLVDEENNLQEYQFVSIDSAIRSVRAINSLHALSLIRTDPENNKRVFDRLKFDKSEAKKLAEEGSLVYSETEEVGAPIGQENDILRIMFENAYSENEIDLVRRGFKTKDVFYRRQIDQIKRKIVAQNKKKENVQGELKAIILKAKEIEKNRKSEKVNKVMFSRLILGYVDLELNG
jgi:ERCC4-related helicase/HKD family nuclease